MNQDKKVSIIYVNFSPYTNAGSILDYIVTKYPFVLCFTFHFYSLGKKQEPPILNVYKEGKLIKHNLLLQTPVPLSLQFLLLPIRSFLIFLQILYFSYKYKRQLNDNVIFFTVNGFVAWCGIILKTLGLATKTIFWVWDYYPPIHHNILIALMRNLYTFFDTIALKKSDRVIFLNQRIADVRKSTNVISPDMKITVVPIGTHVIKSIKYYSSNLVFFGVIKSSQGLDIIFDYLEQQPNNTITLHIIGSGPDELKFKRRAKTIFQKIIFHGYIKEESTINTIIQKCAIGVAPYLPDIDSVTPYTDPSKLKRYISCGLPVITTNITEFSYSIKKLKAGIIIKPTSNSLKKAINTIFANYLEYKNHAITLAKKYEYSKIYLELFEAD